MKDTFTGSNFITDFFPKRSSGANSEEQDPVSSLVSFYTNMETLGDATWSTREGLATWFRNSPSLERGQLRSAVLLTDSRFPRAIQGWRTPGGSTTHAPLTTSPGPVSSQNLIPRVPVAALHRDKHRGTALAY